MGDNKILDQDINKITRKEAIKKMGRYAALTAIGSFLILNPKKAQASSAGIGVGDQNDTPPDLEGFANQNQN